MATLAQIAAQIKVVMLTVTGTRPVHDYERLGRNNQEFINLYKDPTTSRLWGHCFFRESTRERDNDVALVRILHRWRFYSFISIDDADASQKLLENELESLAAAFRANRRLNNTVVDVKDMEDERGLSGLQVERIEPVMFAGVLCFRATWSLTTETEEPVS